MSVDSKKNKQTPEKDEYAPYPLFRFILFVVLAWLLWSAWEAKAEPLQLTENSRLQLDQLFPFLPDLEAPTEQSNSCLASLSCPYNETLAGLIGYAAVSAPTVGRSVATADGARGGFAEARWAFAPTPSVSLDTPLEKGGQELSFALDQPLWTGGRLSAGLELARAAVGSADAGLQVTQFQVAQQMIEQYGNWLSAWLRHQAWQEGGALHQELVALVERRVSGGASGRNELQLAKNRQANVQTEIISARASRELALAGLQQFLGQRPDEQRLVAVLAAPFQLANSTARMVERALAISPFVQQAQSEVSKARADNRQTKAAIMPTLSARYEYLRENVFDGNNSDSSTLSLQLNSNFGAGLSRLAQREQTAAAIRAAEADLNSARRSVEEQVSSTQALLQNARLRTEALTALAKGSQELLDSYQRQFRSGRRSWMDVMNSAREVADNKAQLADARATLVTTSWKLALYLKGLDALVTQQ